MKSTIFKEVLENNTSGQLFVYLPRAEFKKGDVLMIRKATEPEKTSYKLYKYVN